MHDSQIEDRLRTALRAEGEALPLTITPDELERRLALRRRERHGRRMGVLAAGLAVIALGSLVATTAGWIRMPAVGSGPEASTQPLETPYQSLGPAATPLAGILPLVAIPGRTELIRIDPTGPIDRTDGGGTAVTDSTSVAVSMSCVGEGRLELAVNGATLGIGCGWWLARAPNVWFDVADGQVDLTYLATGPISFGILVERPGAGETPPTADEPACDLVDSSLWPEPPSIGAGVLPGDTLRYGGVTSAYRWNGKEAGNPGTWEDVPTDLQIILKPDAEDFLIDGILVADGVVSRQCLYDVRAEALPVSTTDPNPAPITLAIQRGVGTREVDIELPQVGVWLVKVRASFATADGSPGWSETTFRVIVRFDAPALTMIQGASDARTAKAGCPSYQLASGAGAADQCGAPYEPITDIPPLGVPWVEGAGPNTLVFTLSDGWQINQARVTAVQADLVASGSFAPEDSVAFVDQSGFSIAIPIPLDPGTWILRVSLNGSKSGDTFGAYYDLPLQVGPRK